MQTQAIYPSSLPAEGDQTQLASVVRSKAKSRERGRTCVGCREADEAQNLVRVLHENGLMAIDLGNKSFGRGAWVHPRSECIAKACKGGFQRAFNGAFLATAFEVTQCLRDVAHRRIVSLLSGARGSHNLALGTQATIEAQSSGRAQMVLIATDSAAVERGSYGRSFEDGRLRVWGNKGLLGSIFARAELGVVAVLDAGFARALTRAVDCAVIPLPEQQRSVVSRSMEDR